MANFYNGSTGNFGASTAWVPDLFSKKVQIAFRKASVCEAVCNTD